jgi:hypothetical protein
VGAILYLSFIRYLSALFLLVGIVTLPNLIDNTLAGGRYRNSGLIGYLAAGTSVANAGSESWTPCTSKNSCSGHGFCAPTCDEWQQEPGTPFNQSLWNYACGTGPFAGIERPASQATCVKPSETCSCMLGWTGEDCSVPAAAEVVMDLVSNKQVQGWCNITYSVIEYVNLGVFSLESTVDRSQRDASVCSGHGWCQAVPESQDPSVVMYSFCQCDSSWHGSTCDKPVTAGPASMAQQKGPSNRCAVAETGSVRTPSEVCPSTSDQFLFTTIVQTCGLHGFCQASSVDPSTGLIQGPSGLYRPQTPGVCFCRPGFDGEQCLGGKQLPATQTSWTGLGSMVIVGGMLVLYRKRRVIEAQFDDANVTPSDFTVFVDNLPLLRLDSKLIKSDDTADLYHHFERIGPVHFIAPATNDAPLLALQHTRVMILEQLQMEHERVEYSRLAANPRRNEPSQSTRPSQQDSKRSLGSGNSSTTTIREHSSSVVSRLVSQAVPVTAAFREGEPLMCEPVTQQATTEASKFSPTEFMWISQWEWLFQVFVQSRVLGCLCLGRRWMLQYLAYVSHRIEQLKHDPSMYQYNRAFVTFSYADHKWTAIKAFSPHRFEEVERDKQRQRRTSLFGQNRHRSESTSQGGPKRFASKLRRLSSARDPPTGELLPEHGPASAGSSRSLTTPSSPGEAEVLSTSGPHLAGPQPGVAFDMQPEDLHDLLFEKRRRFSSWMTETASSRGTAAQPKTARGSAATPLPDSNFTEDLRMRLLKARLDADLPAPEELIFRDCILQVRAAPEPEEVIWQSLDRTGCSNVPRAAFSIALVALLGFGGWYAVTGINESRAGGVVGFAIAGAILLLNWLGGCVFRRASDLEQHYNTGDKTRWLYVKVLVTQIVITILAAVVAVYGYPADGQNRYVQDWYLGAGSFILRTVIVESVVPPLLNVLVIPHKILGCVVRSCFWHSVTTMEFATEPPQFILAEKCASLMRTVLMAAALSPGMPLLSFFVAAGLFARSIVDSYSMHHVFAMQKSGPQLIRIMELTLFGAAAINIAMARIILNRAASPSMMGELVFVLFVIAGLWACSGYFTWKVARSKDCCCGTGHVIPWSRYTCCCGQPALRRPFEFFHDLFMSMVFGYKFFERYEDSASADLDETGGQPYHDIFRKFGLRRSPYLLFDRILLFTDALFTVHDDLFVPIPVTGAQYLETTSQITNMLMRQKRGTFASNGGFNTSLTSNASVDVSRPPARPVFRPSGSDLSVSERSLCCFSRKPSSTASSFASLPAVPSPMKRAWTKPQFAANNALTPMPAAPPPPKREIELQRRTTFASQSKRGSKTPPAAPPRASMH